MTPQELKNSILQLAIQGRLVEQRPEEGTAEELYRQIQREKAALVKAGKIKKEKPLPEITEEEVPFEIPEGWKWVRIGHAFNLQAGKNVTSADIFDSPSEDHPYQCYGGNGVRGFVSGFNQEGKYAIIGRQGALCGNINIADGQFYATEHAVVVDHFGLTDVKWSAFFLRALNLNQYATATAQPGLAVSNIVQVAIPLPPLAEQKRIVAKIEELLPYIDRYEKAWSRLEDFNKRFPTDMQKSILQLAIQGKLVPQRPEEGTGEALYQQIQAEKQSLIRSGKLKKEKSLPEITPDEIPFDIPESWKWVRLKEASLTIVDCPHSTPKYYDNDTGFYAIGTKCMDGKGEITQLFNVDEQSYCKRNERLTPQGNDIVYSREGSIVCRAVILPLGKRICLGQRVMLIRPPKGVYPKYLQMYLMTDSTISILTQNYKGVGVKHINVSDVCNVAAPLPPLAEQKRIVAKLKEILPLCERLK